MLVQTVNDPFRIAFAQLPFDVPRRGLRGQRAPGAAPDPHARWREIIAEHERSGADTGDVVSMLVAARDEEGGACTPAQMRDHLVTLFVAGHETSANALAWTCYLLAQHPAVTRKLLAEVDGVLTARPPAARRPGTAALPGAGGQGGAAALSPRLQRHRMAAKPFEWEGYTFHEGDIVTYSPFVSHRMPPNLPTRRRSAPSASTPTTARITALRLHPLRRRAALVHRRAVRHDGDQDRAGDACSRFRLDLVPGQHIEAIVRTTLQPDYGILMRPQPQDGHADRSPAPVTGNVLLAARRKP